MKRNGRKGRRGLLVAMCIALMPALVWANLVNIQKTGQSTCWDEEGKAEDCDGTGQDGDIQAGVEWPVSRFESTPGSDCVLDKLTGLTWTAEGVNMTYPPDSTVDMAGANITGRDFQAIRTTYTISGSVKKVGGEPFPQVKKTLSGAANQTVLCPNGERRDGLRGREARRLHRRTVPRLHGRA